MTVWAEMGLYAAEQLEVSVGPFLALASYKRLWGSAPPIRDRALVGALRCAVALRDEAELEAVSAAWASASADAKGQLATVKQLLVGGLPESAARLARAESARTRSARAEYVRVRTEEAALLAPDPLGAWRGVVALAREQGDAAVLNSAGARFVAAALARTRRDPELALPRAELAALGEACANDGQGSDAERLLLARARLLSAGKFQRAAALSELVRLAGGAHESVRPAALASVLRHADGAPHHLDRVEWDRVEAALKLLGDARRAAVGAHLRALRAACEASWADAAARVAEASGDEAGADVAVLTRARARLSPDAPAPVGLYGRAARLLASSDPDAQRAAIAFYERALRATSGLPPPSLTALSRRAGALPDGAELAEALLAEAVRVKEPAARLQSAFARRARAYDLLRAGDREAARVALKEARALFEP